MRGILLIIFLGACATKGKTPSVENPPPPAHPWPSTMDLSFLDGQATLLVRNLLVDHRHKGFIVSRDKDRNPVHYNDAAVFTGMAVAILPCILASQLFKDMNDTLELYRGEPVRNPDRTESTKNGPVSLDSWHGYVYGLARYLKRCGGETWGAEKLYHHTVHNKYKIGDDFEDNVPRGMRYFFHTVLSDVGVGRPSGKKLYWTLMTYGLAEGVESTKNACYHLNLAFLEVHALAKAGVHLSEYAGKKICSATRYMGLPQWDWYCSRLDVAKYLADFEFHKKTNHMGSCNYETENVGEGYRSPSLDWLFLYALASGQD